MDNIQEFVAEVLKQAKAQQDSEHMHHYCHHHVGERRQPEEAKGPEADPVDMHDVHEHA